MSVLEFQALLPLIIPAIGGTMVLLLGAIKVPTRWLSVLTLLSLIIGGISLASSRILIGDIASFFTVDSFGVFILALLYISTFIVTLLSGTSLEEETPSAEVFYGIMLYALTGMGVVVATNHLAAFFLGLEIYTACLYILIGFFQDRFNSAEAAIKYLVLGALSSGFILMGIAFLYLGFGTLELATIAQLMLNPTASTQPHLWLSGTALIFVGACFKLSLVPFHMWAPDVYQGAPTAVTALIATASKMAILGIVIRYLSIFAASAEFIRILEVIIIISLIVGNVLALYQQNLKRLLAYSSIAHVGYALVPLCRGDMTAISSVLIYIITYLVTVLAAFGFILKEEGETATAGDLDHYRGLGHVRPLQSAGMALAFFSLAGIPMTAGFIGKWSIFQSALAGERFALAGAVVLGAGIGVFYYLRVVAALYFQAPEGVPSPSRKGLSPSLAIGLAIVIIGILYIGLYPEPVLTVTRHIASSLEVLPTAEILSLHP